MPRDLKVADALELIAALVPKEFSSLKTAKDVEEDLLPNFVFRGTTCTLDVGRRETRRGLKRITGERQTHEEKFQAQRFVFPRRDSCNHPSGSRLIFGKFGEYVSFCLSSFALIFSASRRSKPWC